MPGVPPVPVPCPHHLPVRPAPHVRVHHADLVVQAGDSVREEGREHVQHVHREPGQEGETVEEETEEAEIIMTKNCPKNQN